jgi:hypothetical protein
MAGVACYCCCYGVAAWKRTVVLDVVRQQDHHDHEPAAGGGSKTEGPTTTTPQRVAESGRPAQGLSLLGEIASLFTVENLCKSTVYERHWETCITAEQTKKQSNENHRTKPNCANGIAIVIRMRTPGGNEIVLHFLAFAKPFFVMY